MLTPAPPRTVHCQAANLRIGILQRLLLGISVESPRRDEGGQRVLPDEILVIVGQGPDDHAHEPRDRLLVERRHFGIQAAKRFEAPGRSDVGALLLTVVRAVIQNPPEDVLRAVDLLRVAVHDIANRRGYGDGRDSNLEERDASQPRRYPCHQRRIREGSKPLNDCATAVAMVPCGVLGVSARARSSGTRRGFSRRPSARIAWS